MSNKENLVLLLSELEKICIDAYIFSASNRVMAFKVCKGITDTNLDNDILLTRSNSWINSERVKAYIKFRKHETINSKLSQNPVFDKNGLILELENLYQNSSENRIKSDILIKIADLKGYKKDQSTTDKEVIRYYLPINCNICPLKLDKSK